MSHLGNRSFNPLESSGDFSPSRHLAHKMRATRESQSHPTKLLLNPDPQKLCEIINVLSCQQITNAVELLQQVTNIVIYEELTYFLFFPLSHKERGKNYFSTKIVGMSQLYSKGQLFKLIIFILLINFHIILFFPHYSFSHFAIDH